MNTEHTEQALEHLKSLGPEQLKMDQWFSNVEGPWCVSVSEADSQGWCGSVACFAGHVQAKFVKCQSEEEVSAMKFAAEFLGITSDDSRIERVIAGEIFSNPKIYGHVDQPDVTLDDVIRVVDAALAAGDWAAVIPDDLE